MPLHPVRTTANTAAEHVDDHNAYRAEFDAPTHTHSGSYGSTRAYRATSVQTITTATNTAITLTDDYDDDNLHDNSTNPTRVTIATTGRYRISGQIEWASSTTGHRSASIWLNGTGTGTRLGATRVPVSASLAQYVQAVTGVVPLTAGDYLELGAWHDAGANRDVSFGQYATWLNVERVS